MSWAAAALELQKECQGELRCCWNPVDGAKLWPVTLSQILYFAAVVGLMVTEAQAKEPILGVWSSEAVAAWWQAHPQARDWQLGLGSRAAAASGHTAATV